MACSPCRGCPSVPTGTGAPHRSEGASEAEQLHALEHAWEAAAERTPHGQAVELSDDERRLAH